MSNLERFPAPHVAVDVAVLTVPPDGPISVLLVRRSGDQGGMWALPGRFVRERERLSHAVTVTLEEKVGLSPTALREMSPRQLHVFDEPDRDDRGWVMSAAHLLALPFEQLSAALESEAVMLARIDGARAVVPGQRRLPYGQDAIVEYAVEEMRRLYSSTPDPEGLIAEAEFTLAQLHDVHTAVLDAAWQIDTFRRHMIPQLVDTGQRSEGGVGRPAALYQRAAAKASS